MCCIHWQKCNKCRSRWQQAYRPCSGLIYEGKCELEECVGSFLQNVDTLLCYKCTPRNTWTASIMPQWRPIRRKPEICEDYDVCDSMESNSMESKDEEQALAMMKCKEASSNPQTEQYALVIGEQARGPFYDGQESISLGTSRESTKKAEDKENSHVVAGDREQSPNVSKSQDGTSTSVSDSGELSASSRKHLEAKEGRLVAFQASGKTIASHNIDKDRAEILINKAMAEPADVLRQKFHLN